MAAVFWRAAGKGRAPPAGKFLDMRKEATTGTHPVSASNLFVADATRSVRLTKNYQNPLIFMAFLPPPLPSLPTEPISICKPIFPITLFLLLGFNGGVTVAEGGAAPVALQ